MNQIKIAVLSLFAAGLLFLAGCKDEEAKEMNLLSIVANGTDLSGAAVEKDLNGAVAAEDVPLTAVLTVTFDKPVQHESVEANVTLTQNGTAVSYTHTHSGNAIIITPDADLLQGTTYTLAMAGGLKAEDGGKFFAVSREFETEGHGEVMPPQAANMTGYWKLDGNANSADDTQNGEEVGTSYGNDRFDFANTAAIFDGDVSLIEIPDGDQLLTQSMTLSFWLKVNPVGHLNAAGTGPAGHFVMGVGDLYGFFIEIYGDFSAMKFTANYKKANGTGIVNDFFFNGDGGSAGNGGWVAIDFETNLTPIGGLNGLLNDKWAQMVVVYDASKRKRHLFINGDLMETDNLNNAPGLEDVTGLFFDDSNIGETIGNSLALGFNHDRSSTHWNGETWGNYDEPGSNHFKGMMDDLRFWNVALTSSEVMALYAAEKP
ncbi:MAG: Ig-like domain-containing protein [Bacteroidetes bacterium]|nr:Ig-like domain-containing protein [Bacteroidota bacterium]